MVIGLGSLVVLQENSVHREVGGSREPDSMTLWNKLEVWCMTFLHWEEGEGPSAWLVSC